MLTVAHPLFVRMYNLKLVVGSDIGENKHHIHYRIQRKETERVGISLKFPESSFHYFSINE